MYVYSDPHVLNRLQHPPSKYLSKPTSLSLSAAYATFLSLLLTLSDLITHSLTDTSKPNLKTKKLQIENLYYDAVSYTPQALTATASLAGIDRLFFGTDNPFFPPLENAQNQEKDKTQERRRWESVDMNLAAISEAFGGVEGGVEKVLGKNAYDFIIRG
jgi:hypothetical protein